MNPLKRARLALQYSQQEFADFIGTTAQTVKLYEAGQKTPPTSAYSLLGIDKEAFEKWKKEERYKVHLFINHKSNLALSGQSNEYCGNLLYFKSQLNKDPTCESFDDFIKTYFTSKSFCSKLLLINHSTLNRHVNGFPVPMKTALKEIGLSKWCARKESEIYG